MNISPFYFSRVGRIGKTDLQLRIPELMPLSDKKVAIFGLGCIGAPSALEFARAGVNELRLLDHDIVDPGTIARWPFGLSASGLLKTQVLSAFIGQNYPSTKVIPITHRLGSACHTTDSRTCSDWDILDKMVAGVSLIYDATAEWGIQHFLSDYAKEHSVPYISVDGTFGGWGGKVFRFLPGREQGCWVCYKHAIADGNIIEPPAAAIESVQPPGCGDPTFTGAGFDLAEVALNGVRFGISTLCNAKASAYPFADWDVMTMSFRDDGGALVAPKYETYKLEKKCNACLRQ